MQVRAFERYIPLICICAETISSDRRSIDISITLIT